MLVANITTESTSTSTILVTSVRSVWGISTWGKTTTSARRSIWTGCGRSSRSRLELTMRRPPIKPQWSTVFELWVNLTGLNLEPVWNVCWFRDSSKCWAKDRYRNSRSSWKLSTSAVRRRRKSRRPEAPVCWSLRRLNCSVENCQPVAVLFVGIVGRDVVNKTA